MRIESNKSETNKTNQFIKCARNGCGHVFEGGDKMYTISTLAKEFDLSRSTLIYYDKKDILKPSFRDENNNYRNYSKSDHDKLQQICTLRSVGIPLAKIKEIIDQKETSLTKSLRQRLFELDGELKNLRNQQRMIAQLLGNKNLLKQTRTIDKQGWIDLLRTTGMDEEGMIKWHHAFEKNAPKAHQDFLEFLGIDAVEIKKIRKNSK